MRMTEEAARFLKECRSNIELAKSRIGTASVSVPKTFEDLGKVHELAVKAIIVEKGGSAPEKEMAISMCQAIGLWDIMPPRLKKHLTEVKDHLETTSPAPVSPQTQQDSLSSNQEQWQQQLETAVSFISFVENHVLACPPVLKGIRIG